ncbi:MAG TPA: hypothetical protein VFN50_04500 [Acidimicrobiales bacterium]|nr:hypothetical protein [Acidimicrobiales bacterium]
MKWLLWLAVPLMLLGAAMLLADVAAAGIWIAVITVGIALVAVVTMSTERRLRHRQP